MTLKDFREKRSEQKRNDILKAAKDCFRRDGFSRTGMESVARQANVSTATLYRNYRSKSELFAAVATDAMAQLDLNNEELSKADEHLRSIARAYARLLSDPEIRGLFRMVVAECGRDQELAAQFYGAVKARLSDLFIEAIEWGQEANLFKPIGALDEVAGQLQGMIEHSTLMRGLVLGDEIETMSEAERIADESLKTWLSRWAA